jgi:hypothetical protein
MRRTGGSLRIITCTASLAVFGLGGIALGQVGTDRNTGQPRNQPPPQQQQPPPPASDRRTPLPGDNRVPLPSADQRAPLPGSGNRTPAPGTRQPSPGQDPSGPPRNGPDNNERPAGNVDRDAPGGDRRDDRYDRDRWRNRRPYPYYNSWVYDRNRYYDDGYRPYDPQPYPPDVPPTQPPGADRGNDARNRDPLLPPEDLVGDEDTPPALRKALDASPQYREATAQLLRAWADYARAAEQVMQRLRATPRYQRATVSLREAEQKVVAVREQGGNVPAVNLVSAAQDAMLARRAVRALEEQAIDADPLARRAKEQVDQAVDRRNKIRDDIASKLQGEAKPEAGQ